MDYYFSKNYNKNLNDCSITFTNINKIYNLEMREILFEHFIKNLIKIDDENYLHFINVLNILKCLYESGFRYDQISNHIQFFLEKIENKFAPGITYRKKYSEIEYFNQLINSICEFGKFITNKRFYLNLNDFLLYCIKKSIDNKFDYFEIYERLLNVEYQYISPNNLINLYEKRIISRTITINNTISLLKILIYFPNFLSSEILKNFILIINDEMKNIALNKIESNYILKISISEDIGSIIQILFYQLFFDNLNIIDIKETISIFTPIMDYLQRKLHLMTVFHEQVENDSYNFEQLNDENQKFLIYICRYYKIFIEEKLLSSFLDLNTFNKFSLQLSHYYYNKDFIIHRYYQHKLKLSNDLIDLLKKINSQPFTVSYQIDFLSKDVFL